MRTFYDVQNGVREDFRPQLALLRDIRDDGTSQTVPDEDQVRKRLPAHLRLGLSDHEDEITAQRLQTQVHLDGAITFPGAQGRVAMVPGVHGEDARLGQDLSDLLRAACEREPRGACAVVHDEERPLVGGWSEIGMVDDVDAVHVLFQEELLRVELGPAQCLGTLFARWSGVVYMLAEWQ
mgnify:CR=1 FL=1